ncbi:MAG: hypothetical protein IJJ26_00870 [Victivallales bacterium]|nr:hypothetical protein [Victivallales bacterium]
MKHSLLFLAAIALLAASSLFAVEISVPNAAWKCDITEAAGPAGQDILVFENDDASKMKNRRFTFTPAQLNQIRGRKLAFSAKIKADDVVRGKEYQNYLGIKLMIVIQDAEGKLSYKEAIPYAERQGNYDWKPYTTIANIPADAKSCYLCIGIEHATGKVSYCDIKVVAE